MSPWASARYAAARGRLRRAQGVARITALLERLAQRGRQGGRQAGVLFVIVGVVGLANDALPGSVNAGREVLLDLVTLAIGAVAIALPWGRWPARVSTVLLVPAMGIYVVNASSGFTPQVALGIYLVVILGWMGYWHGTTWCVLATPLAAAAYVLPFSLGARDSNGALDAVFLVVPTALAIGVILGRSASGLKASEGRFRILAATAPIGILEVSASASVELANSRISEITGMGVDQLMGRGWLDVVHPDDVPALMALINSTRPDHDRETATVRLRRTDGELRHVKVSASSKGGSKSGHVITVEDVTEEIHAQEELAHRAFYDTLTGLPNRALLLDRLKQELARTKRNRANLAVLFLDLDRFKTVNDTLGHHRGDEVLKQVGDRFEKVVRAGETAARFSGDEFVFIIRDVREVDDAVAAAKRVLQVLDSPIRAGGEELVVTGSIGIVLPEKSADAATVLRNADTAMYYAKEAGRNRFEVFNEALHERIRARLEMEGELRKALERQEFELYYQPGVYLGTGRPMGAEALIRWHNPTRGLVPPLDFVPLAEELGLIVPMGIWVLEQAFAQTAEWDGQADGPHLQVVSVNLSARQLEDPGTPDLVRDLLKRYDIAAGRVALEVTESVVMSDGKTTRSALRVFKDLGVRVAIDDFGTGYSSLAYLHTLPVTTVKIDRSFIERLDAPDDSSSVVKAIVDMAHAMGLRVVAEGIGNERLRTLASGVGCDVGQGFVWTPPLPAKDFARWWRETEVVASENDGNGRRIPLDRPPVLR